MNIIYSKNVIMISIRMGANKSLIYQIVPLMNPMAKVLTIIPTIILIKDQKRELK